MIKLTKEQITGVVEKFLFMQNNEENRRKIADSLSELLQGDEKYNFILMVDEIENANAKIQFKNRFALEDITTDFDIDNGILSFIDSEGNPLTIKTYNSIESN